MSCRDTVFVKQHDKKLVILEVYVDVIIVTRNDQDEIAKHKSFLHLEFELKELGILKYFLGIEVARFKLELAYLKGSILLILWRRLGNLVQSLHLHQLNRIMVCI